jgi:hypothetical protein
MARVEGDNEASQRAGVAVALQRACVRGVRSRRPRRDHHQRKRDQCDARDAGSVDAHSRYSRSVR